MSQKGKGNEVNKQYNALGFSIQFTATTKCSIDDDAHDMMHLCCGNPHACSGRDYQNEGLAYAIWPILHHTLQPLHGGEQSRKVSADYTGVSAATAVEGRG
jgi:hypothetical protein